MSEVIINTNVSVFDKLNQLPSRDYFRAASAWHLALSTLKPNARVQYVRIHDSEAAASLIKVGLLRNSTRITGDIYIIPKTLVFASLKLQ